MTAYFLNWFLKSRCSYLEVIELANQQIKSPFCDSAVKCFLCFVSFFNGDAASPTEKVSLSTDLIVHKPLHCESFSDANAVQQPQMANQCPPYLDSGKHDRRYKSRWSALDGCSFFQAGTSSIFISIPGFFFPHCYIYLKTEQIKLYNVNKISLEIS